MTNKTISITCDSDNVVALNAFSKALSEMAQGARNARELHVGISFDGEDAKRVLREELSKHIHKGLVPTNQIDTTAQQVESLASEQYPVDQWVEMVHPDHNTTRLARSDAELEQMTSEGWVHPDASDETVETVCVGTPTLDSEGLPWDSRIHSTNKATVADGTWRLRRKPKDVDEEQWQAEIKTVRNELEQLMAIEPGEVIDEPEIVHAPAATVFAPVPPPVVDATHIVTDIKPVGEPSPVPGVEGAVSQAYTATVEPIAPPVTVAVPPPVNSVEAMTFPKMMTFLTQHHGKITVEQVNELVAKHGLTNIQQFAQRPDLIGTFVADVKTLLGE